MDKIRNCLLLVANSLRWDFYCQSELPKLLPGMIFECITQAGSTPAAFASMLTGFNPPRHKIYKFEDQFSTTLIDYLRARGFNTDYLSFDWAEGYEGKRAGVKGIAWMGLRKKACQHVEPELEPYLTEPPFFLVLHFQDPHPPYSWPMEVSAFQELLRTLSDEPRALRKLYEEGIINLANSKIKPLLSRLKDRGLLEETLIVLTGDHGEILGESYTWAPRPVWELKPVIHTAPLIPELLQVPLVFSHPNLPRLQVKEAARLVDIYPTILTLLDQPIPYSTEGVDLLTNKEPKLAFSIGPMPFEKIVKEPMMIRTSVRYRRLFYAVNEKREALVDFCTKEEINNENLKRLMKDKLEYFKHNAYNGIPDDNFRSRIRELS
jgi:hypothetical protein